MLSSLLRPRHIIIADEHEGAASKHIQLRLILPVIAAILLLAGGITLGVWLAPRQVPATQPVQQSPDTSSLRQTIARMQSQLAELQAENAIKINQVKELNKLLQQQQRELAATTSEKRQLEGIILMRKKKGMHIMDASLLVEANQQLRYSTILIKGGSYPRRATGKLRFIGLTEAGEEVPLIFEDGDDALSYLVETHTFVHGVLKRPENLSDSAPVYAVLTDYKDREVAREKCSIKKESL